MLRATCRALSWVRGPALADAAVLGRPAGRERAPRDLLSHGRGLLLQAARGYALQKPAPPSHDADPAPSTLLKDYQNVPGIDRVDDVVKKLLSLEMADQKEKKKIKTEQLRSQIVANPEDTSSLEARIVALTVKIHSYEEHMQKHRKDKAHKRYLLMSIDQRKKMLKSLRETNYAVFEKTCKVLGIEYTFTPQHHRKAHRRLLTKKELCIRVFQETQKLKKQRRALKAAAKAQKQKLRNPESPSKAEAEAGREDQ
ncbi:small ribosomal subunit protein uS15m isoform X1 [Sorex fumeus]|uniref:small ribosomal subunit protein uS15m isoform X1 n=1 Tax=Sorex fumeus TaxID=62283 RepID=UPI0024AD0698|nr:small ribosomal subunit protein uS15m isoform X1 [Sorex fumeus]